MYFTSKWIVVCAVFAIFLQTTAADEEKSKLLVDFKSDGVSYSYKIDSNNNGSKQEENIEMVTPVLLLSESFSYNNDPKVEIEKNVSSSDDDAKRHEAVRVVKVVSHNGSVAVEEVSPRMEILQLPNHLQVQPIPTTESVMDSLMHEEWFDEVKK